MPYTIELEAPIPRCGAGYGRSETKLPDLPTMYKKVDANYVSGSREMIDAILVAAQQVAWDIPDADPIHIGHIDHGGVRSQWLMHQDGIDADIGLFTYEHRQSGFGTKFTASNFDVEASWQLIRAFLATGRVKFILLDQVAQDLLKDYLREQGATRAQIDAVFPPPGTPHMWEMEGIIRHAPRHDNHMHVHMACR